MEPKGAREGRVKKMILPMRMSENNVWSLSKSNQISTRFHSRPYDDDDDDDDVDDDDDDDDDV